MKEVRKRPLVQVAAVALVVSAIGVAIALLINWFPADGSTQSSHVRTLYDVLLIVSVPMFALVATTVLYSVWKFRARPGDEERDGPPIHGNTRLEVVWTALPALLLICLCVYSYIVLRSNEENKPGAMVVNVTARQFAFEFAYTRPDGKQVASSQLYVPKGQPVVFRLHSLDVVHSFFVPNFSEKLDAVPGIVTTLRVTPTHTGTYPVECTELCGAGHSLMRSSVNVVSPAAFKTWLSAQSPSTAPPVGVPPKNAASPGVPGSSTPAKNPAPPKI